MNSVPAIAKHLTVTAEILDGADAENRHSIGEVKFIGKANELSDKNVNDILCHHCPLRARNTDNVSFFYKQWTLIRSLPSIPFPRARKGQW